MAFYRYQKRKPKLIKKKIRKPFFVPLAFFSTGLFILAYIGFPYFSYYVSKTLNVDTLSKELLSPKDSFTVYAFGDEKASQDYTKNAAVNIAEINSEIQSAVAMPDISSIKGYMYITVDKIGLKNIPVTINTQSDNEQIYDNALSHSVAHFKGTSLPSYPGKTFLYGHSARGLFNGGARNFSSGIFTDIDKLNLGDEISIKYNDKVYKYNVYKIKLVEKDNLSVIKGDNKKTLSLMTCKPDGIGTERLIVDALQVEE